MGPRNSRAAEALGAPRGEGGRAGNPQDAGFRGHQDGRRRVGWGWGVPRRERHLGCGAVRGISRLGFPADSRKEWGRSGRAPSLHPRPRPRAPPSAGPPRTGAETAARCGLAGAATSPPRPPRLTSPRGPGGAGPRSRVPLQQPPPARS